MLKRVMRTIRRLRGASGSSFVSFMPYLQKVCEHFGPKRVLEFGPGKSTRIFLAHSEATIVSIENSREWYDKYKAEFTDQRVRLIHKPPGWDLEELREIGGQFDCILVDGGDRTAELKFCVPFLADEGIVYLHDAHREEYEPGIRSYPHIFFPERHSCVMCKSPAVLAELKKVLVPDYTCRCKYCNTEVRNRYLAAFLSQ